MDPPLISSYSMFSALLSQSLIRILEGKEITVSRPKLVSRIAIETRMALGR